jgi:hypothetical protein
MSVTIVFPPDIEATLRERLARVPQNVTAFVVEAVREKLSRSQTLIVRVTRKFRDNAGSRTTTRFTPVQESARLH